MQVPDGQEVKAGGIICEWDPFASPILTEVAGKVQFGDIIEGVTTQEQIDDYVDWAKVGDIEHVSVMHDSTWDVYTDSAFVDAARTVTGIADLDFTEQGMQDDNVASMEV